LRWFLAECGQDFEDHMPGCERRHPPDRPASTAWIERIRPAEITARRERRLCDYGRVVTTSLIPELPKEDSLWGSLRSLTPVPFQQAVTSTLPSLQQARKLHKRKRWSSFH